MKITKEVVERYQIICKCGKIISSFNKKQVEWNYEIHKKSCDKLVPKLL